MKLLTSLTIKTIAVLIAAQLVPGVRAEGVLPVLIFAVVLGFLNTFLRPILLLLTLPINIVTLGLFTLVINTLVVLLAGFLVTGFTIVSFWSALVFGAALALINALLGMVIKEKN